MKLTPEQYQQIINSIGDETVDLSFIRNLEVEDIIYQFKTKYPERYNNLDEESKENFENLLKYKFRGLN
ncbi:MAG: hypothetical protein HC815_23710 [Richelia sp. RM1_1_1]|nr:hypothetical protein [Richelia sp. RM1_1_1]